MEQNKNAVTDVTEEELAKLIAKNSELQKQEMLDGGVQPDYILLAKNNTKALDPTNQDLYIENLKIGDFFLQKDKVILGNSIKVVPLMFLTVYNEKDSRERDARMLGKWSYEQGSKFPLAEGSYFDRQLPNGHILSPSNWVVVEVSGHAELEFAVVAYKSTGSRIWKQWKEDVRKRSGASATLVYTLKPVKCENAKGSWLDIAFEYTGNLLESNKAMAVKCLTKSNELRDLYNKQALIEAHSEDDYKALPPATESADNKGDWTVEEPAPQKSAKAEDLASFSNSPASDDDLDDLGF